MNEIAYLYHVLSTAVELEAPTFQDIRDAVNEAREFGLPVHELIPDLIETNIAFVYLIDDEVHVDTYSVSSITVNIEKKVQEYLEKGYDLIGFIHTHTPQSVMPSVSDIYAIISLQSSFPECISAIKRRSGEFDTVFAFKLRLSFITTVFERLKVQYEKMLTAIEPNFVFDVPDVIMRGDETIHTRTNLPVYDETASNIIDTTTLEFLLRNNLIEFAAYNKIPLQSETLI